MKWYVLYTKPRNEKKLANLLALKGFTVYCPVQEVMKQWSDRKKKVIEPLFKSYIFVQMEDYKKESEEALRTNGSVRFLWWLGQPALVLDKEIEAIRNFLALYKNVQVESNITKNTSVVITEGPLKSSEGVVLEIKKNIARLKLLKFGMSIVANVPVQALVLQD
jgi:transcription antitermination factor NusG